MSSVNPHPQCSFRPLEKEAGASWAIVTESYRYNLSISAHKLYDGRYIDFYHSLEFMYSNNAKV